MSDDMYERGEPQMVVPREDVVSLQQLDFDEKQAQAIEACVSGSNRLVGVTGKAGTGKTTIIRAVYDHLTAQGLVVACSAPTGKAARRIREATGLRAVTNHKLLGYGLPDEREVTQADGKKKVVQISTGPRWNARDPLGYDVLLCDEFMMVNEEIYTNLIDAMKPGARMCVFGDMNQLRPIEPQGHDNKALCPFERTLAKFTNVRLDTIHRTHEGSGIAMAGAMILDGRIPRVKDESEFFLQFTEAPLLDLISAVKAWGVQGIDYSSTEHQILTCMNKSWIGTKQLNTNLQQMFWSDDHPPMMLPRRRSYGNQEREPEIKVQVGSKIIFTQNCYDLNDEHDEVMNGEVGIITELDFNEGHVTVDFGDREVVVPPITINVRVSDGRTFETDPRHYIDLAYALTTHKAQGSEYQHVMYVMNRTTQYAQSRRNLYTGVTRARQHCTLMTDQFSLTKSTRYPG